jgi:hypothetical protein
VGDKEGIVYGVIIKLDESKLSYLSEDADETSFIYSDTARVDAEGFITLRLPFNQPLKFLPTSTIVYKTGQAALVRLSGDMGLGSSTITIPPDEFTLE